MIPAFLTQYINCPYDQLDFTNDFLFCKIMSHNLELCRQILEVILQVPIRKIELPEEQKRIDITLKKRGVRLDVYVADDNNTIYNIEMQTTQTSHLPKRTRYYRGMIDLNLMEKGSKFSDLKRTVIIFICLSDPFSSGFYKYSFEMRCKENLGYALHDETETIFLNADGKNANIPDSLKKFLTFLKTGIAENELCHQIEVAVHSAKSHTEWRSEYMTLQLRYQELMEHSLETGLAKGRTEGRMLSLAELVDKKIITISQAAEFLNITENEFITASNQLKSQEVSYE